MRGHDRKRVLFAGTHLIRLSHIAKHAVYHSDEHAILGRQTSILHNGDDVGAALGDIDEITARAMAEMANVSRRMKEKRDLAYLNSTA